MNLSTRRHPLIALFLTAVMVVTSLPIGVSHAGMVTTKTIIEQQTSEPTANEQTPRAREQIRSLLARDDVRTEMVALGIAPAEAEARIAALTDSEIADIAGKLDQLPAGEGLGTVLIVLFIVFGIAVMLDALGMMDIFPFVCSGGNCGSQVQAYYPEPAAGGPAAVADPYAREERRPAYRRERYDERYDRQAAPRGYDSNQYYEPQAQPQPRTRNYYEERFGAQRYVR